MNRLTSDIIFQVSGQEETSESGEIRPEIRPEIRQTIEFIEKIISGEKDIVYPDDESLDPNEVFSGPILDLNDESLTGEEIRFVESWMRERLRDSPENSPVRARYRSPDGGLSVTIFDVPIGDGLFLSKWQNLGGKPSYVLWPQDAYDWQLDEAGYTVVLE